MTCRQSKNETQVCSDHSSADHDNAGTSNRTTDSSTSDRQWHNRCRSHHEMHVHPCFNLPEVACSVELIHNPSQHSHHSSKDCLHETCHPHAQRQGAKSVDACKANEALRLSFADSLMYAASNCFTLCHLDACRWMSRKIADVNNRCCIC